MSERKPWNLTSTSSIEGAAEWMRKRSGGLLVLIVRPADVAFAVDPKIAPADARAMVDYLLDDIQRTLQEKRSAAHDGSAAKPFPPTPKKRGWSV